MPRSPHHTEVDKNAKVQTNRSLYSAEMQAVVDEFGDHYEPFVTDTELQVLDFMKKFERDDTPPERINPWECRIGLARFIVPPLNIKVGTSFRAGPVGSALRQPTPPKFNAGHSETTISMTIYFPNHESIWGFSGDRLKINLDEAPDKDIDGLASSLRGLITQFKYSPFLPIDCAYLNQSFGINAVVLENISVQTVDGFPFVVAATLDMLKFNYGAILPMVSNFDQAIHWGRFRHYIGRGLRFIDEAVSKNFLTDLNSNDYEKLTKQQQEDQLLVTVNEERDKYLSSGGKETTFDVRKDWRDGRNFELYYPAHTPANLTLPDLTGFRDDPNVKQDKKKRNWWELAMGALGFDIATERDAGYESASRSYGPTGSKFLRDDKLVLEAWLDRVGVIAQNMDSARLDEFVEYRVKDYRKTHPNSSGGDIDEVITRTKAAWFAEIYSSFIKDGFLNNVLQLQEYYRGKLTIKEWDLPMQRLELDQSKIVINGISVSTGNALARMQLQLQGEPTYQHLGGTGTEVMFSLIIFGEEEVAKLRLLWDHINGLARLEHGHGVLGFVGVKNVLTALCGMKYALPTSFEVETIESYPHVYNVQIGLTDFDIFQQKREQLSSKQQQDLIEAFTKLNPFLRIKQYYSAFSAYPDFPLAVRDDDGSIIGHLDPDWYFKAFKTIDDDVVDMKDGMDSKVEHVVMSGGGGPGVAGMAQSIIVSGGNLALRNSGSLVSTVLGWDEANADQTVLTPTVDGLTPLAGYQKPYKDGSSNPQDQFGTMMKDAQFRDRAGRMARVFPTYMLWLIDEGGSYTGVKLYDNFYGLQSVIDIAVGASEDPMSDTLIIQLSNLYSKLTTPYRNEVDPNVYDNAQIINTQLNRSRNLASGLSDYLVQLDTVELKPGVRVHLRLGYSSNPNALATVFNGVITNVEPGEVVTITAQSDAVELSAIVNDSSPKGHTGTIDGSATGLWMTEPRDLMVRLLSMGGSTFREYVANLSRGRIFSENRFGIRHFGTMLYEALTDGEKAATSLSDDWLSEKLKDVFHLSMGDAQGTLPANMFSFGMLDTFSSIYINSTKSRDYEVFKRNIYPGNGLGLAQYQGGDLGDGALALAYGGPMLAGSDNQPKTAAEIVGKAANIAQGQITPGEILGAIPGATGLDGIRKSAHSFGGLLGITQQGGKDDDLKGADEVSFKASTYMKTVWDLFQICAALLPNYIVAIRPFEERSTVFYGKPHWQYTSGVFPVTKGIKQTDLKIVKPDETLQNQLDKARLQEAMDETDQEFYDRLSGRADSDPTASSAGMAWDGRDIMTLPLSAPPATHGDKDAKLPVRQGKVVMEMHLPTSDDLATDVAQHRQVDLAKAYKHPFYMDRTSKSGDKGGVGGVDGNNDIDAGTIKKGDDPDWPGQPGAFGILDPDSEQWYMNMRWPYTSSTGHQSDQGSYRNMKEGHGKKILVYNNRTRKGVICTPGDWGPSSSTGNVAGISPDAAFAIGLQSGVDVCTFGFVEEASPLGPVNFGADPTETSSGVPSKDPVTDNAKSSATKNVDTSGRPEATASKAAIPDWMKSNGKLRPEVSSLKADQQTPDMFSYNWGWKYTWVPVDYTDPDSGLIDDLGSKAREVYQDQQSDEKAEKVWDEFRTDFAGDDVAISTFNKVFPGQTKETRKKVFEAFMQFMWQNAYHRGWLVRTVDAQVTLGGLVTGDIGNLAPGVKPVTDAAGTVIDVADSIAHTITSPLGGGGSGDKDFNWHNAQRVFEVWLADPDEAKQYMQTHTTPGKDQTGLISRAVEEFNDKVLSNVLDLFKGIAKGVGAVASGLLNLTRLSMMLLGSGASAATHMQKASNRLNRAYNDSVYYAAGPPGSLLRLCDNPFTREYGEPVVEIRQSFQKVHLANSFINILHNGIQENTEDVANMVTATTDGKHAVTVYLDKATPPERQHEAQVETGLVWASSGSLGGVPKMLGGVVQAATAASMGNLPGALGYISGNSALQGWATHFNNGDQETSAKRIALWHLKENLKNIYGGEIILMGDPHIRPHDLLFISDVYEHVSGLVEVEQVIHHFNGEMGFVTSVTPNAIVIINDPARWNVGSYIRARLNAWNLRNDARVILYNSRTQSGGGTPSRIGAEDLFRMFEPQIMGALQYTGGNTALVKDVQSSIAGGVLTPSRMGPEIPGASGGPLVPDDKFTFGAVGAVAGGYWNWAAWDGVKKRLLDQHGCYIQFLTKNGMPMDASLHDNKSIAVGQQRTATLFKDSFRIKLPYKDKDGNTTIATDDLLGQIGWDPLEIGNLVQDLDLETNLVKSKIMELSGRDEVVPLANAVEAHAAKIVRVIDADTVILGNVRDKDGNPTPALEGKHFRLAGVNAPEVPHKGDLELAENLDRLDPGVRAWRYATDMILDKDVVVRINPNQPTDVYGRALGWIFHNVPLNNEDDPIGDKIALLMAYASKFPYISWDSFLPDGRPYTFNWQLVLTGHANVYLFKYDKSIPGEGVDGGWFGNQKIDPEDLGPDG